MAGAKRKPALRLVGPFSDVPGVMPWSAVGGRECPGCRRVRERFYSVRGLGLRDGDYCRTCVADYAASVGKRLPA